MPAPNVPNSAHESECQVDIATVDFGFEPHLYSSSTAPIYATLDVSKFQACEIRSRTIVASDEGISPVSGWLAIADLGAVL